MIFYMVAGMAAIWIEDWFAVGALLSTMAWSANSTYLFKTMHAKEINRARKEFRPGTLSGITEEKAEKGDHDDRYPC